MYPAPSPPKRHGQGARTTGHLQASRNRIAPQASDTTGDAMPPKKIMDRSLPSANAFRLVCKIIQDKVKPWATSQDAIAADLKKAKATSPRSFSRLRQGPAWVGGACLKNSIQIIQSLLGTGTGRLGDRGHAMPHAAMHGPGMLPVRLDMRTSGC